MEPADPIQEAIRLQGVHLGQQAGEISALHQGMEAVCSNMQHLLELLTPQMTASPVLPPPPPGSVSWPSSEPCLPAPERYEGDPRSCRSFLSTCSLNFELQPSSFPSKRSRVAYVITLLSGRAREWGTAVWEANTPECQTFSKFSQAMRGVFDRSVSGPAATRQLFRIRQGQRSISDYAIEFRTLAAGWGEQELHVYFNGLSEWLLDELSTCELPTSLDALIDLTLHIDTRLADHHTSRRLREPDRFQEFPKTWVQTPLRAAEFPETEPMQIGRTKLSMGERQRWRDKHLCWYCRDSGHLIVKCPLKRQCMPISERGDPDGRYSSTPPTHFPP